MSPSSETLSILYQDENIIAINKPTGLLVHRSPIDRHETRFAIQLLRDQIGQYVYPAHRLDKPTSGVLLFALNSDIASQLAQAFQTHKVEKSYLAVLRGYCPDAGHIDHPLTEEPDKRIARSKPAAPQDAITNFRRLATYELDAHIETYPQSRYSLVLAQPMTGRRHQLRRHFKHISHPIIGDAKHGRGRHNRYFAEQLDCPRLLLHALQLRFIHPLSKQEIQLQAPLDHHFTGLIKRFSWGDSFTTEWQAEKVTKL
ncbi:MAG: tRNA pseudouridine65 synthase [Zhongshania aliphaticivorans]|jgi:tRNA pseudouridine65 synthase|uniref:pseudouridine synthase n=1 Tax=Zhongshania aliphaticivorans TaxID=1470434 RepID=UPI0039E2B2BB